MSGKLYKTITTSTPDEIQDFYKEEIEYQDTQDAFEETYIETNSD